ncbi:glycerophosphodiester phosphodiesterase [Brevibacillus humidisoli]|uniref:glycerophosphodiester phosphodiesterase n=1 Tax=Brevibacillus humidisoli TaxID=2895522 RepID=UPI001E51CD3F|nr:glycerophosphodiester phosphodiesterase [Brevibacillus humidisoli]UFJ43117.1 glycerophosphodiester phosphodiesterase [Brevibacillus humidisoli]
MRPWIFAHRGASARHPENTLEAFRAAIRLGADGIELDVQLTSDGEVVVIHDPWLDRTTDGTGLVQNRTFAELRRLSAGSWFDPRFSKSKIPSLREVLALVMPTRMQVILELKNFFVPQPELEKRVVELLRIYEMEQRAIISSFNFNSLLHIKELAPAVRTGLLYIGHLHEPWDIARQYQTEQLHVPKEEITPSLIRQAHRHRLEVIGWTINSSQTILRMRKLGIDGIITNYPRRARKVLHPKLDSG